MKDKKKTKRQLIQELMKLRKENEELKSSISRQKGGNGWKEMYNLLVNISPNAVLISDLDGRITNASKKALEMYGCENEEELKGKDSFQFIAPEDRERAKKNLAKALENKSVENIEYSLIKKDGTSFIGELSAALIKDNQGKEKGFIATVIDITDRKKWEEKIKKNEEKFRLTFENAKDAIFWADPESGEIINCNKAAEELLQKNRNEIVGHNQSELHPPSKKELYTKMFKKHIKGKGVIDEEAEVFTKSEKVIPVHITASLIKVSGETIVQGIFRDITEQKRIEQTLKESEEKYRALVEKSLQGIIIIQDWKIVYTNSSMVDITGYTIDEMKSFLPEEVHSLIHPDDQEMVWGNLKKRLRGESVPSRYEFRGIRRDGEERWLEIFSQRIEYNGKPAVQGAFIDITERKQTEEAIRKSEEQYRTLQSHIPVGVFRTTADPDGQILSANPALAKMFGYNDPLEMAETKVADLYFNQNDRQNFIEAVSFSGSVSNYEAKFKRKDGTAFWGSLTAQAVSDEEGKISFFDGILENITQRKKAEEALLESEEKYRKVVDNSLVGLYINQEYIIKFCNNRFAEMFGYKKSSQLIGKHIKKLVAPESWEMVKKQVELRESGEKGSSQYLSVFCHYTIHFEFKGIKRNGERIDIETSGSRIIYEGKPAIQGNMIDITERKLAEEKLRVFATTDVLTDVLNRGYALLLFGKKLQMSSKENRKLSICYVDVDGLKEINDTYGHQEGDEALKLISSFLKSPLTENDLICRLGGDEFLMIFPEREKEYAEKAWKYIAKRVVSFNARSIKPYVISLSRGFAEYDPENPKSVDQLIAMADYEMYKDKHSKPEE
jgi:diguanylate cyclase (GGDEF)-like protein/PAS domain S-box-containing protein